MRRGDGVWDFSFRRIKTGDAVPINGLGSKVMREWPPFMNVALMRANFGASLARDHGMLAFSKFGAGFKLCLSQINLKMAEERGIP